MHNHKKKDRGGHRVRPQRVKNHFKIRVRSAMGSNDCVVGATHTKQRLAKSELGPVYKVGFDINRGTVDGGGENVIKYTRRGPLFSPGQGHCFVVLPYRGRSPSFQLFPLRT